VAAHSSCLVLLAAVPPREVVDAFLAPAAVNASLITTASGLTASASLMANAGRVDAYDRLSEAVNIGLAFGFVVSVVPTLATLVVALQSIV